METQYLKAGQAEEITPAKAEKILQAWEMRIDEGNISVHAPDGWLENIDINTMSVLLSIHLDSAEEIGRCVRITIHNSNLSGMHISADPQVEGFEAQKYLYSRNTDEILRSGTIAEKIVVQNHFKYDIEMMTEFSGVILKVHGDFYDIPKIKTKLHEINFINPKILEWLLGYEYVTLELAEKMLELAKFFFQFRNNKIALPEDGIDDLEVISPAMSDLYENGHRAGRHLQSPHCTNTLHFIVQETDTNSRLRKKKIYYSRSSHIATPAIERLN